MAASFVVSGNNVTIRMEWTLLTAQAQAVVKSAAELLYTRGLGNHGADGQRAWSTITDPNEWLAILYAYTGGVVANLAKTNDSEKAAEAARQASLAAGINL